MSIKLSIRGIPVEVATPEEAWELIRLSEGTANQPAAARPNGKAKESGRGTSESLQWTVDLLRAIQGGGASGVASDRIVSALAVATGKAIGGRMAIINKLLQANGFNLRDIYSSKKTADGRIWRPRKGIDTAISTIDQKLKNLQ